MRAPVRLCACFESGAYFSFRRTLCSIRWFPFCASHFLTITIFRDDDSAQSSARELFAALFTAANVESKQQIRTRNAATRFPRGNGPRPRRRRPRRKSKKILSRLEFRSIYFVAGNVRGTHNDFTCFNAISFASASTRISSRRRRSIRRRNFSSDESGKWAWRPMSANEKSLASFAGRSRAISVFFFQLFGFLSFSQSDSSASSA